MRQTCNCWVKAQPQMAYGIHWGAHHITCPVYRRSLDPVDDRLDCEIREHFTEIQNHDSCQNHAKRSDYEKAQLAAVRRELAAYPLGHSQANEYTPGDEFAELV